MIEVTDHVEQLIVAERVRDGMAIVYVPHTTAAVTINENADPDVKSDMLRKLELLVPKHEAYYRHGEGNSDSHVKTSLVGNSVTVLIEQGRLVLGRWQGIYFCEFDGPRERKMHVKVVQFDSNPRGKLHELRDTGWLRPTCVIATTRAYGSNASPRR